MGLLRLFLACVVVVTHTSSSELFPFIGGKHAVRIFFIISGFYMAMILTEKYREGENRKWLFYSNRALRIFPLFWMVLGLELVTTLFAQYRGLPTPDSAWLPAFQLLVEHGKWGIVSAYIVSQVSSIGVDLMFLFTITKDAALELYNGPAGPDEFRGWRPLPMGQMWSISCELLFYAVAPFLNRLKPYWLVLLCALTMGMAITSYHWMPRNMASIATDFMCLMQMGYFLAGMVAYHVIRPRAEPLSLGLKCSPILPFVALMLGFNYATNITYTASELGLYLLTVLALPTVFSLSGKLTWDRWMGNLSYPVYLVHVSVIRIADQLGYKKALCTSPEGQLLFTALCIVASILLAAALTAVFDDRLNRWRQQRIKKAGSPA